MKVIILSGGFGTRISEYTSIIHKPMIRIDGKPIIEHIMEIYSNYGHNEFYLALGYKSEVIKEYFYNYGILNSNFKIDNKQVVSIDTSVEDPFRDKPKKFKVAFKMVQLEFQGKKETNCKK